MRRLVALWSIMFFAIGFGSDPARSQQPLPAGNVAEVVIRDLVNVPEAVVRAVLRTRVGQPLSAERLAQDVAALRQLGFFEAVFPAEVQATPAGPRVVFRVREYPPVEAIEFSGNTAIPAATLRERIPLRVGQAYNPRTVEESIAAIERTYRERGYIAAASASDLALLRQAGLVRFDVIELRVAAVRFEGLRRTNPEALRRLLLVQPGDRYREPELAADRARLRELDLFTDVQARVEITQPGEATITWIVNERKTRDLRLGISVGGEGGAIGSVAYSDVNFRGRAERLSVVGIVGTIEWQAGGAIEFFDPWIAAPGVRLHARVYSEPRFQFSRELARDVTDLSRYFERRQGTTWFVTYPQGPGREFTLGARLEAVDLEGLPLGRLRDAPDSADADVALVSAGWNRAEIDDPDYPTRGKTSSLLLAGGIADHEAAGLSGLGRLSVELRRFWSLRPTPRDPIARLETPRSPVVALRLAGGTTLGDPPFFEQFFLGGIGELRGYLEDRFWGEHFALASTELRWPFGRRITGVLFVDVGDAWASEFQFQRGVATAFAQHSGFAPRVGYGVGLRVATPVGLARLELGIGEAVRVHFALGGGF